MARLVLASVVRAIPDSRECDVVNGLPVLDVGRDVHATRRAVFSLEMAMGPYGEKLRALALPTLAFSALSPSGDVRVKVAVPVGGYLISIGVLPPESMAGTVPFVRISRVVGFLWNEQGEEALPSVGTMAAMIKVVAGLSGKRPEPDPSLVFLTPVLSQTGIHPDHWEDILNVKDGPWKKPLRLAVKMAKGLTKIPCYADGDYPPWVLPFKG